MQCGARVALALLALLGGACAQDYTTKPEKCGESATPKTITNLRDQSNQRATQNDDGQCFPNTNTNTLYEVSGIVTAVGIARGIANVETQQNRFFLQEAGQREYAGLEVFEPGHVNDNIKVGANVTVTGVLVNDPEDGQTTMHACDTPTVNSKGNSVPEPVQIDTTMLYQGKCNQETKKLEGMLVNVTDAEILPCGNNTNPLAPGGYPYCSSSITPNFEPTWDKFTQMWVRSTGGDTENVLEVDNHGFSLFENFDPRAGNVASGIVGVVTRHAFEDDPRWELSPRSKSDVSGLTPLDEVIEETVLQLNFSDLVNTETPLGNNEGYIPPEKRGQYTTVNGTVGAGPWNVGSCPPSAVQLWMDADYGNAAGAWCNKTENNCEIADINPWSKTHSLCACYPLNYVNNLGTQASFYVNMTARVVWAADGGFGSYFLEDPDCSATEEKGVFVYRPSGEKKLNPGQKVNVIAKPYAYYGLEQLSDTFRLDIVEDDIEDCGAVVLDSAAPFDLRDVEYMCEKDTDAKYSQKLVNVSGPLTVTGFTEDKPVFQASYSYDMYGTSILRKSLVNAADPSGYPYQNHGCAFKKYDTQGRLYFPGCQMKMQDANGYMLLVDNKYGGTQPYYTGEVSGMEGMEIEIGDQFDFVVGMVEQHRGEFPGKEGVTGGHYELNPRDQNDLGGWRKTSQSGIVSTEAAWVWNMLSNKANKDDVYSKGELDTKLSNVYSKSDVDTKFAKQSNVYSKSEVDSNFAKQSNVYSKSEVDSKVESQTSSSEKKGSSVGVSSASAVLISVIGGSIALLQMAM